MLPEPDGAEAGLNDGLPRRSSRPSDEVGGDEGGKSGPRLVCRSSSSLRCRSGSSNRSGRKEGWGDLRISIGSFVSHPYFDASISVLIMFNMCIVWHETDVRAESDDDFPLWLTTVATSLLAVFIVEISLRIYVWRISFFYDKSNLLDFTIVVVDVFSEVLSYVTGELPSFSVFRILRVFRAIRFVRVVRSLRIFRELYMMLHGFVSAIKAIAWATVLLILMLAIWGIIAVELIHPTAKKLGQLEQSDPAGFGSCERCGRAFESVLTAFQTFFQTIVAGDSWGAVAIPIMEDTPWTMIIFMGAVITVDLGLLNLILSVIVDRAAQARADDHRYILQQKEAEFESAKRELLKICEKLDEDQSGCLSLSELESGYEEVPEFQEAMSVLDVSRDDLKTLFQIMDEDNSGDVAYSEFVEQLHKMKVQDSHMMLVFMSSHIKEVRLKLQEQFKWMQDTSEKQEHSMAVVLETLGVGGGSQTPRLGGAPSVANGFGGAPSVANGLPKMHLSLSQKQSTDNPQLRDSADGAGTKALPEPEIAAETESTRRAPPRERWETAGIHELELELEQLRVRANRRIAQVMNDFDVSLGRVLGSVGVVMERSSAAPQKAVSTVLKRGIATQPVEGDRAMEGDPTIRLPPAMNCHENNYVSHGGGNGSPSSPRTRTARRV